MTSNNTRQSLAREPATADVEREAIALIRDWRKLVRLENVKARAGTDLPRDAIDMFQADMYTRWPAWRVDEIIAALSRAAPSSEPAIAEGVTIAVRQTIAVVADYGDNFMVARVSSDGKVVGIDHPCDASWTQVATAQAALRDYINERIAGQDRCPFKPRSLATTPPTTNDAIPDNVRRLVVAAREVFDGAGICFPEADALDKALKPFSALVPYENQPDDAAAPSAPATEAGEEALSCTAKVFMHMESVGEKALLDYMDRHPGMWGAARHVYDAMERERRDRTPKPATPAASGEIPGGMVDEQDWMQMARDAAASVRPNSPWAGRVRDGMRDDGDEVRSAMAAIAAVCALSAAPSAPATEAGEGA